MTTVEGKVVILGSQGVGKTSIVVQYIGKMFSHHISPTIGASFFTCKINVNNYKVKLQVWDTAGQERFRSMAPMYYRNASAAVLVFDITDYHTFKCIKYWVQELERNVEEPMILSIVGNKTDLEKNRNVSQEEAEKYAESIGANYFEASAMNNIGVDDVFLSTAMGLVSLSGNPKATSIRVNDVQRKPLTDDMSVIHASEESQTSEPRWRTCC